jgi:NAD(P)-dependent dehydrogenase (short-subunit alcohol dehydrogenase family)
MELGLRGKKAVVTGASRGLGRAIAIELAAEGCDLAVCARGVDDLREAASEFRGSGVEVYERVVDVTDPGRVQEFLSAAAEALGGIDILINNAGRAQPGNFGSLSDEDWQNDIDVKLFSMVRCTRAVLPHMRRRGGGRIVNINAVFGKYPHPDFFATSVNRAACLSFTKTLSMELAEDNILVNAVNIGYVESSQWERIRERRAPDLDPEAFFRRTVEGEVPLGRFGRADEVSGVVAFLVSERASYVTGASVDVAGGMGRYL